MGRKIRNLDSINSEIRILQVKAKILEEKLDDNLEYLQDNYSSMIMGSIFNKESIKSSLAGSVAGIFLGNEKLQDAFSNIGTVLAEKASFGLEKLAEKLTPKSSG